MNKKAFRYFFHMLAFTAVIAFAWPACCCFADCVQQPAAVEAVEMDDDHGCCPKTNPEADDVFKECECHARSRVFYFFRESLDADQPHGMQQAVAVDAADQQAVFLSSLQEDAALTYTGPPIFILNCVYRC